MDKKLFVLLLYFCVNRTSTPLKYVLEGSMLEAVVLRLVQIVSISFIIYFLYKSKKQCNMKPLRYIGSIIIFMFFPSLLSGSVHHYIAFAYPAIAYSCLILYAGQTYRRLLLFVDTVSSYYIFISGLNLYLTLFAPTLFGDFYLLGGENFVGYTLLIGVIYNVLYTYMTGRKFKLWVCIAIYVINTLVVWSGGAVIGGFVLLVCLLFPFVNKIITKTPLNMLILAYAGIYLVIVIFNSTGILDGTFVEYIVVDILGKDMTFTKRTYIWLMALVIILDNPFIGHGIPSDGNFVQWVSPIGEIAYKSAHNQILQSMYEGGFVLILLIILSIIYLSNRLKTCKNDKINNLFKAGILGLFFMFLVEAPSMHFYYEIFILACAVVFVINEENFIKKQNAKIQA